MACGAWHAMHSARIIRWRPNSPAQQGVYGGLVAAVFASLGIWIGLRLTQHAETAVVRKVVVAPPVNFARDQGKLESLGITPRELRAPSTATAVFEAASISVTLCAIDGYSSAATI